MQEDCTQCHHEPKPKRRILTLKPAPDACPYDPFRNQEEQILRFKRGETKEQERLRDYSRQLAEARNRKRELSQERSEQRRREVKFHAETLRIREERATQEREWQRRRWYSLLERAVSLGLQPAQDWNEQLVRRLVQERQQELRQQAQRAADQQKLLRRKSESERAKREELEGAWEHIPYVVKFGDFGRGAKAHYGRGDLASFNQDWQPWSCGGLWQDRLRLEHFVRTGILKRGRMGKGARNPQKQRRTWKAAAPRKWRRKDQCVERWNHLFD